MVQYDTQFSLLIGHSAYCDETHAAANACNQVYSRNLKSLVSLPRPHPASTVCRYTARDEMLGGALKQDCSFSTRCEPEFCWEQIEVLVHFTTEKQIREDALGCREVSSTINTRGGKPCCKGGHTADARQQGGLYLSNIFCPKVRRFMAPSDTLKSLNRHVITHHFINQDSKRVKAEGRLASQAPKTLHTINISTSSGRIRHGNSKSSHLV